MRVEWRGQGGTAGKVGCWDRWEWCRAAHGLPLTRETPPMTSNMLAKASSLRMRKLPRNMIVVLA